jgi:hypothetical protein
MDWMVSKNDAPGWLLRWLWWCALQPLPQQVYLRTQLLLLCRVVPSHVPLAAVSVQAMELYACRWRPCTCPCSPGGGGTCYRHAASGRRGALALLASSQCVGEAVVAVGHLPQLSGAESIATILCPCPCAGGGRAMVLQLRLWVAHVIVVAQNVPPWHTQLWVRRQEHVRPLRVEAFVIDRLRAPRVEVITQAQDKVEPRALLAVVLPCPAGHRRGDLTCAPGLAPVPDRKEVQLGPLDAVLRRHRRGSPLLLLLLLLLGV